MHLSKLSQNAREAVDVAQAVVRRGRSNALGTEHLLLGLLAQQGGVVHQVFEELSLDLGLAQWKTNDAIKRNDLSRSRAAAPETDAPVHLTPRAKRALELANEEANGAASPLAVGTEHLLLGLLRVDEGSAAMVLREVGLTETDARAALKGMRGEGPLDADPEGMLAKHGRDITQLARDGKLDPVVGGREDEIKRVLQILARRTKNNPALIGEPGVGKTAIVEGLAEKMARGYVPEVLKDKTIVALNLGSLVAGTKFRGEFEERLKRVMDEVKGSHGRVYCSWTSCITSPAPGLPRGRWTPVRSSNPPSPAARYA